MKWFLGSRVLRALAALGVMAVAGGLPVMSSPDRSYAAQVIPPSGIGTVAPQRVSTAMVPQIHSWEPASAPNQSGRDTHGDVYVPRPTNSIPALSSVSKIPVPTTRLSTAHAGLGQTSTFHIPADANGAGGVDNYMETVNAQFGIYSRGGSLQYATTFQNWFGSLAGGVTSFFDANVIYDQFTQRFIFEVTTGKDILLSVAQQANATSGSFCNYRIPPAPGYGVDYTKLGVDGFGIYLATTLTSRTYPTSNEVWVLNKTKLESCGTVYDVTWTGLKNPDGTLAYYIQPAVQDTSSAGYEYLVNSYPNGACQMTLWKLAHPTIQLSAVSVPTACYAPPPNAPQKGTTATLVTGDCSLSHLSFVNGLLTLTVSGSYDWGDGNGPVGVVQWFVLNASQATVASQGAFGIPGYWLIYPAAVRNYNGNLVFVYGVTGTSIYPSLWTIQYVGGAYTGSQIVAQGTSSYGASGAGAVGWGDYQSVWLDDHTIDPNGAWITGEYGKTVNAWSTEFGLVAPQ